jgi:hypothetical protein
MKPAPPTKYAPSGPGGRPADSRTGSVVQPKPGLPCYAVGSGDGRPWCFRSIVTASRSVKSMPMIAQGVYEKPAAGSVSTA